MNRDSFFSKSPREDTQKSQEKCKAFEDISKYFSKKAWKNLSYSEKITYVYTKRNYVTMSNLGLKPTLPSFMHSNGQTVESQNNEHEEGSRKRKANIWSHRLRERKNLVVYEEISDPEEEEEEEEEEKED
ncbi:protein SSXA1-like, partial [Castor canadensis]|uniref:Protein SSXA1-like n=1 Tax=Castor canadensis TaxID=51338 RepID=A0AC58LMJ4_CASCN